MQTVWLEFKREGSDQLAALGTDTTFYIDGRWSWHTTSLKIWNRVDELREAYPEKYGDLLFVGITYSQMPFYNGKGGAVHTMPDPNPPEWATCICNAPHESCECPMHPTCQGRHLPL